MGLGLSCPFVNINQKRTLIFWEEGLIVFMYGLHSDLKYNVRNMLE